MRRPRRVLVGGVGAGLAALLVSRRRRRAFAIDPALIDRAASWVGDTDLPDHVRDVAARLLALAGERGRRTLDPPAVGGAPGGRPDGGDRVWARLRLKDRFARLRR